MKTGNAGDIIFLISNEGGTSIMNNNVFFHVSSNSNLSKAVVQIDIKPRQ